MYSLEVGEAVLVGLAAPVEEGNRHHGPAASLEELLAGQHLAQRLQRVDCEVVRAVDLDGNHLACRNTGIMPRRPAVSVAVMDNTHIEQGKPTGNSDVLFDFAKGPILFTSQQCNLPCFMACLLLDAYEWLGNAAVV